jgi:redox-sensitive bicupin YhaK (pirin superfamily)
MIELVLDRREHDLGAFTVGRVLPAAKRRMVGPFIFFDHIGPVDLPRGIPETYDVRPHPHIGLSTVTYLFRGEMMHRDSVGSEQAIRPGEVNWMIAGRGITHSERFEKARAEGDSIHAIQSWVALPNEDEETAPGFANYRGDGDLPTLDAAGGARARIIAGEAYGGVSRVKTHSPIFYVHWELPQGAQAELPGTYSERAAYVVTGEIDFAGVRYRPGQLVIFTPSAAGAITAVTPATLMLLGGDPVGPRYIEWNFVSSSRDRIDQAKADWRAGRMKLPDLDAAEFIPLPPDPPGVRPKR